MIKFLKKVGVYKNTGDGTAKSGIYPSCESWEAIATALERECPGIFREPQEEEKVAKEVQQAFDERNKYKEDYFSGKLNKNCKKPRFQSIPIAVYVSKKLCQRFSAPDRSKWVEREKVLAEINRKIGPYYDNPNEPLRELKQFIQEGGK